jgi:type IV secretion system protein TrbG
MKQVIGAALIASLPSLANAQTQVPAIQTSASASATAAVSGPTDHPAAGKGTQVAVGSVPSTMPPPIPLVSSTVAPLNAKERAGVALSRRWANRNEMPRAGEDGCVRFLFGATLPAVVCAPLQVCNLALRPGEIVNSVNLGDSVRWKITPSISGSDGTQTTHLIIKPTDAGLVSSLDIETNRRIYAVKLVSTQSSWMPLVAFNYPDDAQAQWRAYQQTVAFGPAATTLPTGENLANLQSGQQYSTGHHRRGDPVCGISGCRSHAGTAAPPYSVCPGAARTVGRRAATAKPGGRPGHSGAQAGVAELLPAARSPSAVPSAGRCERHEGGHDAERHDG